MITPQPADLTQWRKDTRAQLLAQRAALSVAARQDLAARIGAALQALLAARFGDLNGLTISGYWPIKSEPDLRPTLLRLQALGARLALPVVAQVKAPLEFRPWTEGAAMQRGHWNIPVPATDQTVIPDVALAPLVGWDAAGYRLGYGGGYFDRTLGAAHPRPFAIGVGLQAAQLPTIFPQPHDIRLDAIATETGLQVGPLR